jgi:hypothetical protein
MKDDKALAEEAVMMVAQYLKGLRLSPYQFSAQIALCQLLELADQDPGGEVAQWILSAPREKLWKTDSRGMYVDGNEPTHVRFREAWQHFVSSESPTI